MNILTQELGFVIPTDQSCKLTIDGITEVFRVYKVRLDLLFYNEQNDRIATWISQYKSTHGDHAPNASDRVVYNELIEDFIIQSSPETIEKTQTNIALVGQREPGVVLADGRIIDGNRRFTCLRRLSAKNDRFNYFETIILDRDIESSAKQIKMLELSIQHGEESKVEYNIIDRLVGVYNDIVATGLLSVSEYARSTNEGENEVKKRVEVAELMVEFLEFINAPKQFYVVRDMQIGGALEELPTLLKKCTSDDEREDLKIVAFTNLLMKPAGDIRNFMRKIRTLASSSYLPEYVEEQKEIAVKVIDRLPPVGQVNDAVIRDQIRADGSVVMELENSLEKALAKTKRTEARNQPVTLIEKATNLLESIDTGIFRKLNDSELQRVKRQLSRLEETIEEIRSGLDE
ncbi:hypothetical protein FACS1894202_10270 [Clostridia bacterium]|nr:hypothetical protein FACS1894202_10270 [Clostridia bacterium]